MGKLALEPLSDVLRENCLGVFQASYALLLIMRWSCMFSRGLERSSLREIHR